MAGFQITYTTFILESQNSLTDLNEVSTETFPCALSCYCILFVDDTEKSFKNIKTKQVKTKFDFILLQGLFHNNSSILYWPNSLFLFKF